MAFFLGGKRKYYSLVIAMKVGRDMLLASVTYILKPLKKVADLS